MVALFAGELGVSLALTPHPPTMSFESVESALLVHPLSPRFDSGQAYGDTIFPGYVSLGMRERLLLHPFLSDRPQKYFAKDAFEGAKQVLARSAPSAAAALSNSVVEEVTEALQTLNLINATTRDEPREFEPHDQHRVHRLQTNVFAQYARIAEHVFGALLALLLELEALGSGKSTTIPHQLRSRWDMAKSPNWSLDPSLAAYYDPTVRNAITHGGLEYEPNYVNFKDANGKTVRLTYDEAARLSEQLLDACNGIAAALVMNLAQRLPVSQRLASWAARESALCWSRAPLLRIEACYATDRGVGMQAELHGSHFHWHFDALLLDLARATVALRSAYPTAKRFFLSFRSKDGAPCFVSVDSSDVPALDAPATSLVDLGRVLADGQHGMIWLEHKRALPAILGRTRFKNWFNWLDAVERTSTDIDYELRELRNNSVGWRSRFDAYVVSNPRSKDLDERGVPSVTYLHALFAETALRWLVRKPSPRPLGANRFRIFGCGMLHVYRTDDRRSRLRGSGLTPNLLFSVQVGSRVGPPLYGSVWQRIGIFHLSINPRAQDQLLKIRDGAG